MKNGMIGLGLFSLCTLVGSIYSQTPKTVDFCSVFKNAPSSTSEIIVKAYLSHSTVSRVDGADDFLYSPNCNDEDHFITLGNSKAGAWRKFQKIFDRLPADKANVLEISFLGKVEVSNSGLFGSLDGWARGEATITKVLSLRDVTGRNLTVIPNWDITGTEVKRIEALREVVSSFVSNLSSDDHTNNPLITDDFAMTIDDKQAFNSKEFLSFRKPYLLPEFYKSLSISREITSISHSRVDALGKIELLNENRKVVSRYRCTLKLEIVRGTWKIRQANLKKVTLF